MDRQVNFAAVGAFIILLGTALVAAVLWLASGGDLRSNYVLYRAVSDESVSGLNLDALVKYRGVEVGKVKDIHLLADNPQQVQLTLAILKGTPIKTDTVATLTTQGLTGIAFIELSGGSTQAPLLVSTVAGRPALIMTKPSLSARLELVLGRVLSSVDQSSHALDGVFTEQNKRSLTVALSNIAAVTQTLADRRGAMDSALKNTDRTLANVAATSARMDATLERVSLAASALETAARQVDQTARGADQAVTTLDAGLRDFRSDMAPQLEMLVGDVSSLSVSLQRLSEQTRRDPRSLIFGRVPVPAGPGE